MLFEKNIRPKIKAVEYNLHEALRIAIKQYNEQHDFIIKSVDIDTTTILDNYNGDEDISSNANVFINHTLSMFDQMEREDCTAKKGYKPMYVKLLNERKK